jgi:hypothetical protein
LVDRPFALKVLGDLSSGHEIANERFLRDRKTLTKQSIFQKVEIHFA